MRAILTTLLMTACAAGGANAESCAPRIVLGPPHSSLEAAARAALMTLVNEGNRYESGGFMIEKNGKFHASSAVTQRSRSDVSYCIVLPRGAKLAGLYHTHVASTAFSTRDRRNAERAGVPSYIGTIRDRSLFVYEPAQHTARALGPTRSSAAPAMLAANEAESLAAKWTELKRQLWAFVQRAFEKAAG